MATYFHGNPDIQATDGLQTLVLMNPGSYVQYSDTPPPQAAAGNFVFLNSNSQSPHAPSPQAQQLVGIPLPAGSSSHDISALHGLVQGAHYNMYNPIDPSGAARETPRSQQGLSLSLSSSQQQQQGYGSQTISGGSGSLGSSLNYNRVFLSSKYLKAAQEVLDEVVNVNDSELLPKKGDDGNKSNSRKANGDPSAVAGDGSGGGGEAGTERSTAEKHEIQMKKAKLISMLDEVEQRYRQYHHQMQAVISSFEQAAGLGSAKTYTSLALKTISKQFRCLKDAITGQIRAANKSLGEEDGLGAGKIEGSRLKFVDHHLRQQRALQQFGMVQHSNAWRPQRGLPERSVSVLRAWLFEHFLHPYPKDSDKHMLAKQAGLTRSQVSNWFINARVRLWKPMVEEMYAEEIKAQEQNGTTSEDKTSKEDSNKNHAESQKASSTSPVVENSHNRSSFSCIGSSELEGIAEGSPKKPRSNEMLQSQASVPSMNMDINQSDGSMKFSKDVHSFMGTNTDYMGGFGNYPIGEFGRFDAEQLAPRFQGNGVSLTLGPPHCENISLSATHQNFLPNQTIQMETLMNKMS